MPRATPRAGGEHPHRRPVPFGGPARRASLLLLLALGLGAAGASAAAAQEAPSPLVVGPVEAVPPDPPKLPGEGKDDGPGKANEGGGKPDHPGKRDHGDSDALDLAASCAPFTHTQTYAGWGPAVSYGSTVTVLYEAARCSIPDGSALDLSVEGTAKVFEGDSSAGTLLDTRPFLVTGTWREPKNSEAWPPAWWACRVPYASYTWEIPGVYTFQVSARDGLWDLDVTSRGAGTQAVSWTHDGCA